MPKGISWFDFGSGGGSLLGPLLKSLYIARNTRGLFLLAPFNHTKKRAAQTALR